VNVISRRGLISLLEGKSAEVAAHAIRWYRVARAAQWRTIEDVRVQYPSADQVGRVLVFDLLHSRYRLTVVVSFRNQRLYIKALLTHKEYDRKEWKKWE
jgi:mRNA interferase HigB